MKILVINPGAVSTKIAVYDEHARSKLTSMALGCILAD